MNEQTEVQADSLWVEWRKLYDVMKHTGGIYRGCDDV
jgi:hypothetical protein